MCIRLVKGSQVENGWKSLEKKKLVLTFLQNTNKLISSMLSSRYTCFNHSLNKVFKAFYTKIVNTPNFCAENKGGGIMACFFYTCWMLMKSPLLRGASCSEVSLVPKAHMGVTLHAPYKCFHAFLHEKMHFCNTACKFLAIRENGWDDRFVPSHV